MNIFEDLQAEVTLALKCGRIAQMISELDIARLEEKVKAAEAGLFMGAALALGENSGPRGFQVLPANDVRVQYAIGETKLLLFFAKQLKEYHDANCPERDHHHKPSSSQSSNDIRQKPSAP